MQIERFIRKKELKMNAKGFLDWDDGKLYPADKEQKPASEPLNIHEFESWEICSTIPEDGKLKLTINNVPKLMENKESLQSLGLVSISAPQALPPQRGKPA